jgi:hypothetical protein
VGRGAARRGARVALSVALALILLECVQDLVVAPKPPEYSFDFTRGDSTDLYIGDTVAIRDSLPHDLTVGGAHVSFRLDLTVTQGTDVVRIGDEGEVIVLKRGTARVRARPLSTGLVVDTISHQLTVHAVVPRLTAAPETVLTSVNDSALLAAKAQTRGLADIPGVPVVWRPATGADTTFVSLLDSTTGRLRAKADGVANFIGAVDNVTTTRAVRVRQRPVSVVPDSTAITLRAVGRTRQLGAVARDARSAAVASASVAWKPGNPTVAGVTPAGLVTALQSGNASAISYVVRGPGDTVFSSPPTAITVTPAQLSALSGSGQTATVNAPLAAPFVARLMNGATPIADAGDTVIFTVTSGGGHFGASAAKTADTVLTDATGQSATTLTLGTSAGPNVVTAAGRGLAGGSVTFTATGTFAPAQNIALVSGNAQTATVGQALADSFVVVVKDGFGNPVAGYGVTFAVTGGGGSLSSGALPVLTDASGRAFAKLTLGTTAGANTVTATAAGLSGSPVTFTATGRPAAQSRLDITVEPGGGSAGGAISPAAQVAVRDAFGNRVDTARTSITASIVSGTGDPGATVAGTPTVSADTGIARFSLLVLNVAAAGYRLRFSAAGLVPDTSAAFNVTAGAPDHLAFLVQPSNVSAAAAIAPAVQVAVQDAANNTVTTATSDITIALGTVPLNGGGLFGTLTVTPASGVATFSNVKINNPGSGYALRASTQLAGVRSAESGAFNVTGAAANIVVVSGNNQNGLVSTALSPFVVRVADAGGSPVQGDSVIFKVTAGGGKLGGQDTVIVLSDASGQASATLTLGSAEGTNTVTARSKSISSTNLTFNASATAANLHLAFVTQPSNATGGTAFSPAVQVAVQDASNNTVTNATTIVTLAIAGGTGTAGASLGGTVQVAAVNGVATFAGVSVDKVGSNYQLSASASGVTGATGSTFNVTLGAASRLAFTSSPGNAAAGASLGTIAVAVTDAGGNVVTSATSSVSVAMVTASGGPANANLRGTKTVSAVSGVVTFTGLSVDSVGNWALTAVASGLTDAPRSSAFAVNPAPADHLRFTTQPSSVTAGVAMATVAVTIQDSLGNTVGGATNAVSLALGANPGGSTLSGGTAVSPSAGVATFANLRLNRTGTGYTLVVSASGLTGASSTTSATFDVTAAPASRLAFAVQPSDQTPGGTIAPAVQVAVVDSLGNTVTSATNSVTLQITGGTGTGGATLAGTTTVNASSGVATFSNLSISTAGNNYTLTAPASGSITSAVSAPFSILSVAQPRLFFRIPPVNTVAGRPFAGFLRIEVQDGVGNTLFGRTDSVFVEITAGTGASGASLRGSKRQRIDAVSAQAVFTDLSIDTASALPYSLTATSPTVSGVVSVTFTVSPANPFRLEFLVEPSSRTAGNVFSPAIQVAVLDSVGNRTTNATTSVTLAITPSTAGGAVLAGTTSQSTVNGVATFADLSITKVGVGYTLTATASGVTSAVSAAFTITVGVATSVAVSPTSATLTSVGGTQQLSSVGATDAFGNVVSSSVTWSSLNTNVATVSSSGLVTAVASGQVTIAATSGGLTGYSLMTVVMDSPTPNLLVQSGTSAQLHGVWGTSPSNIFAVGLSGTILHWNGTTWTSQVSGTNQNLNGVWGPSPTDVFAVGGGGTILRWDGSSWGAQSSGTTQQLNRVWGTSPADVFVTGAAGTILHWDGASWAEIASTGQLLTGLWGTSPTNVYAVTEIGTAGILRYDGSAWTTQVSGSGLIGVWGTSPTDVFVTGLGGTILHWGGSSWSPMASGTGQPLPGVWGTSPTNVFAAGFGGAILRYDGTTWTGLASGTTDNLQSAWVSPGGDLWAVGSNGTVVRGFAGATVTVTPASPTVTSLGATQQLTPTARDAQNNVITGLTNSSYTWTSGTPSVATVSATGLVTAISNGIAVVIAAAPGGASGIDTIRVIGPAAPNPPSGLGQFRSDGTSSLVAGQPTGETTVVLTAIATDSNPADQLVLEVEVRPVGTAFTNAATATGATFANGATGSVTVTGLARSTAFHWQARACDQGNLCSTWASFGGNSESETDFSVAASVTDATPPVVTAVTVDRTTVDLTSGQDSVVFMVTATDDLSGISSVQVNLNRPSGRSAGCGGSLQTGTVFSGTYRCVAYWQRLTSEDGVYTLNYVYVYDINNLRSYSLAEAQANGWPTAITVAGATPDVTPPVVTAVTVDRTTVDLTAGQDSVVFMVTATDELSGITSVQVNLSGPSGTRSAGCGGSLQTGTAFSGTYRCVAYWQRLTSENGVYTLNYVYVYDISNLRNYSLAEAQANGWPTAITVAGATPDVTPPVVTAVTVDRTTVDLTSGQDSVVFMVTATDDLSGITSVQVNLSGPSGTRSAGCGGSLLTGTVFSGTYRCVAYWQRLTSEDGVYTLNYVFVYDINNLRNYSVAEARANGWPTEIIVLSSTPALYRASLAQYRSNGTTAIAVGATTTEHTVVFKGSGADGDIGDQLRLEVEALPVGVDFTNVATASVTFASGATASLAIANLTSNTSYHWQARVCDQTNQCSAWVSFGANAESAADFTIGP